MGCKTVWCKTSTPYGIFVVTPSLEVWSTKAKEAPSPHKVRLAPLDINPVFQSHGEDWDWEKGLGLVSPPHFRDDFPRKKYFEIMGNMCITIAC